MAKIRKDSKKIENGLKPLIKRLQGLMSDNKRVDYGNAVVEYLAKPENGGHVITRNQVYLLVNNFTPLSPANIFIAKALKSVVDEFEQLAEQFEKDKAELAV